MDELAVQVADDLQMSDIFTALEALGIDDENECAMQDERNIQIYLRFCIKMQYLNK